MNKRNISNLRKQDIIELAELVAEKYVENDNINPELIANKKGIKFCYKNYGKYFDGMLHYMNNRFFIFCNLSKLKHRNTPRARFTFSHELGHYFIIEHRHALQRGENLHHLSQSHFSSKIIIEKEADLFATHLLMPSFLFNPLLKRKRAKKGIEEILFLKTKLNTSITSTALRYIKSNIHDYAMIIWNNEGKRQWYWTSDKFYNLKLGYAIEDAKSLGRKSATYEVLRNKENSGIKKVGSTVSTFFPKVVANSRRNAILHEEAISLGEYGVLTLIYPDGERISYNSFKNF